MDWWYMQAFNDLSTCRQLGMGLGPIPWRDIVEYARFHEIDDDMFPVFHSVIRALDEAYRDWHADQKKPPSDDGHGKKNAARAKTIGRNTTKEAAPNRLSGKRFHYDRKVG